MVIWIVSYVISVALLVIVIFGFIGMIYLINIIITKLTEWREKQWEQRHGLK